MKPTLLILTAIATLALGGFVYQQAFVEGGFGPAAMFGTAVLTLLVIFLGTLTYLSARHRQAVLNTLLAFSFTVVTYFVLDLVAGKLLIVPLSPPLVPDPYRHHALVPDSYAELRQPDFEYIQRVNRLGLRGRETTVEKPQNTRRILMLGDSFTMGKGVQDDEAFSVLLEKMLQESLTACNGGNVEVLNAGVDSYAPVLEFLYLKRELARLTPDLVVLNFDHSDLVQEAAYRHQAVRDPQGEITAVPQVWRKSLYERFLSWTTRNLYFTRVVLVHVNRSMGHRELSVRQVVNEFGREHFAHTLEGDVDRSAQWRDVFDSIGRIKQLSDSMGAEFLLTTYPWAHQLEGENIGWVEGRKPYMKESERTSNVTQQTIRENAQALHIDVLETLPAFQAYNGPGPLYFNVDPHWTPAGQKVMAEALYRGITERQLTRWCASR
jgi:hypothetical protein